MNLVIDASVIIKWVLNEPAIEPDTAAALSLLQALETGDHNIFEPPHWIGEVLAVIARKSIPLVPGAIAQLRAIGAEIVADDAMYLRAADMSDRLKHHMFDTLYHAVALEHGATLVTADQRYFNVAINEGAIVRLRDFKTT